MPETTPLIKAALNLRVGAGFDVYCIEINSCKYFTFKQMLKKMDVKELPEHSPGTLPNHENIRGKDYYK